MPFVRNTVDATHPLRLRNTISTTTTITVRTAMAIIPTAMSISTVVPPTSKAGTTAGTMAGSIMEVDSMVVADFMEVVEADGAGNWQMNQLPDALIKVIRTLSSLNYISSASKWNKPLPAPCLRERGFFGISPLRAPRDTRLGVSGFGTHSQRPYRGSKQDTPHLGPTNCASSGESVATGV